jgi:tetratricopeptide (TPR) repeat protein
MHEPLGIGIKNLSSNIIFLDNLNKAIQAYIEALKIRTIEKYPIGYAMTQNNLGISYVDLAQVRDNEDNLKKAIQSYEEALKIFTVEKNPLYHNSIKSNLAQLQRCYHQRPSTTKKIRK